MENERSLFLLGLRTSFAALLIVHPAHGLRRGLYSCAASRLVGDITRGIPPYRKVRDRMGHPSVMVIHAECIDAVSRPKEVAALIEEAAQAR
jgi:hypothetical protein